MSVIILMAARGIFLFKIIDISTIFEYRSDLLLSLTTGLRYDLKVSVIAYAPVFLFGSLFSYYAHLYKHFLTATKLYTICIFFLLVSVSIANYFFYTTYGNCFDVFLFSFFNEEKKAIISGVWQSYPVFSALLASGITTLLCIKVALAFSQSQLKKIEHKASISPKKTTIIGLVSLLLIVFLARGSIGTFPLGRYHADISTLASINTITPNAFMTLDWARKDYKKQSNLKPVDEAKLAQLMTKVIGQPNPKYHTPKNTYLSQHQPNVVLALMESMGTNFLVDDDPQNNDLLGNLRPHFTHDFLFKRFLAGTTGTWDSIMMMLTQTNHSNISQSEYKKVSLESMAVLPYKRAGYEVSFVYAGASTWRNSKPYLLDQGFDHFYDHDDILKQYPEADHNDGEWGLADEYAFKFAQHLLAKNNKPQMIFIMSLTNHPPFKLPTSYQAKSVQLTERLKKNIHNDPQEAFVSLQTYQYASNSLGHFISNIKKNPVLKNDTIIAVSGDHLVRSVNLNLKNESAIDYAVPFYMYIPKDILNNVPYIYDKDRIGSHRDIFPTLYHFSLSNAEYITLGGQNLFGKTVDNVGYNKNRVINKIGAYSRKRPQDVYPWAEDKLHTKLTPIKIEHNTFLVDYNRLQDMYTRYLVHKQQP